MKFDSVTEGLNAQLYDAKRPVVSQMDHAERQEIRPQKQN